MDAAGAERRTGRCPCGALRVTALGPPLRVGLCHCDDCRRQHGAPFYAAAIYPAAAVQVSGDSAAWRGRHFCPRCGGPVFARSGAEVELHLGALDDAAGLVPEYECWTIRRAAWLPPFPGLRGHARDRDAGEEGPEDGAQGG